MFRLVEEGFYFGDFRICPPAARHVLPAGADGDFQVALAPVVDVFADFVEVFHEEVHAVGGGESPVHRHALPQPFVFGAEAGGDGVKLWLEFTLNVALHFGVVGFVAVAHCFGQGVAGVRFHDPLQLALVVEPFVLSVGVGEPVEDALP